MLSHCIQMYPVYCTYQFIVHVLCTFDILKAPGKSPPLQLCTVARANGGLLHRILVAVVHVDGK